MPLEIPNIPTSNLLPSEMLAEIDDINALIDDCLSAMQPRDRERQQLFAFLSDPTRGLWEQYLGRHQQTPDSDYRQAEHLASVWKKNKPFALLTSDQIRQLFDIYFPLLRMKVTRLQKTTRQSLQAFDNNDVWHTQRNIDACHDVLNCLIDVPSKRQGGRKHIGLIHRLETLLEKRLKRAMHLRAIAHHTVYSTDEHVDNELQSFLLEIADISEEERAMYRASIHCSDEPFSHDLRNWTIHLLYPGYPNDVPEDNSLAFPNREAVITVISNNGARETFICPAEQAKKQRTDTEKKIKELEEIFHLNQTPWKWIKEKFSMLSRFLSEKLRFFSSISLFLKILFYCALVAAIGYYISLNLGLIIVGSLIAAELLYTYSKKLWNLCKWYFRSSQNQVNHHICSAIELLKVVNDFIFNRLTEGIWDLGFFCIDGLSHDIEWFIAEIDNARLSLAVHNDANPDIDILIEALEKQRAEIGSRYKGFVEDITHNIDACIQQFTEKLEAQQRKSDQRKVEKQREREIHYYCQQRNYFIRQIEDFHSFEEHYLRHDKSYIPRFDAKLDCMQAFIDRLNHPLVKTDQEKLHKTIPYGQFTQDRGGLKKCAERLSLLSAIFPHYPYVIPIIMCLLQNTYNRISELLKPLEDGPLSLSSHVYKVFYSALQNNLWMVFDGENQGQLAFFAKDPVVFKHRKASLIQAFQSLKNKIDDMFIVLKQSLSLQRKEINAYTYLKQFLSVCAFFGCDQGLCTQLTETLLQAHFEGSPPRLQAALSDNVIVLREYWKKNISSIIKAIAETIKNDTAAISPALWKEKRGDRPLHPQDVEGTDGAFSAHAFVVECLHECHIAPKEEKAAGFLTYLHEKCFINKGAL
jgi:hypothetical protein